MPQGLHTTPCEQWLRELGILNLEERSSKCILTSIFKYLEVCCRRQSGNAERSVRNAALDSKVEFGLACRMPARRGELCALKGALCLQPRARSACGAQSTVYCASLFQLTKNKPRLGPSWEKDGGTQMCTGHCSCTQGAYV